MGTEAHPGTRGGRRSIVDLAVAAVLLAGLTAMDLKLIATAFATFHSATQEFARATDDFVAFERQVGRSGSIRGYRIQF